MRLQECRKHKLMSLRDLATAANVGPATVHAIEKGRAPSLRTIGKIARALNVDPLEIDEFRAVIENGAKELA